MISTIRPGLLVSLQTSIRGNTKYYKQQLENPHLVDGQEQAKWETTRVVFDPVEQKAASEIRNKARYLVARCCAQSAHGLLCPEDREQELRDAIAEARRMAQEFNEASTYTHVSVNVIAGRVARDDEEAVRSINDEIRSLLRDMESGLGKLDVESVRAVCTKAKGLGQILSSDGRVQVERAVEVARQACRQIVKAGETAAMEVDRYTLSTIATARTAFLDFDGEVGEVRAPQVAGVALDFEMLEAI